MNTVYQMRKLFAGGQVSEHKAGIRRRCTGRWCYRKIGVAEGF